MTDCYSNKCNFNRINEYICLKMSFVNEIITEIPILQMQLNEERFLYGFFYGFFIKKGGG